MQIYQKVISTLRTEWLNRAAEYQSSLRNLEYLVDGVAEFVVQEAFSPRDHPSFQQNVIYAILRTPGMLPSCMPLSLAQRLSIGTETHPSAWRLVLSNKHAIDDEERIGDRSLPHPLRPKRL